MPLSPNSSRSTPLEVSGVEVIGKSTTTIAGDRSSSGGYLWRFLGCINSFGVLILSVLTLLLFFQLQYIVVQTNANSNDIAGLQLRLQNQTAGQIEVLTQKVDQEHNITLYQMAGTFALLASLMTMFHMSSHMRKFNEPVVQRKIVTVLWMSPIYAVTSFFSLVFPSADGYLAVIKDFYEGYVIFTFLAFLIDVLGRGDRKQAVQTLAQHADQLQEPTRCLRGCYHPPPETGPEAKANAVLTECTIMAMQFVFIRPLTSIALFASSLLQEADPAEAGSHKNYFKSPSFYLNIVTSISVFFAFNGLLKFYHAVREDLAWCQPLSKFLVIKAVVFLTFWQGLLIHILVPLFYTDGTKDPVIEATRIQNFLICLEMLFFSIAHWCVFPVDEWQPGYRPQEYAKPGIGFKDFVQDMSYIMSTRSNARKFRQQGASAVPTSDEDAASNGGIATVPSVDDDDDEDQVYKDSLATPISSDDIFGDDGELVENELPTGGEIA
jgi:hypothetical protein